MALGQGSAYPETGCFFSLVWKGPCNAMLFFGEHVSSWKGNLFPLFWIHVLLSPTRSQRKRTIWMPFGCVFLRLCSCQLCGLDSPGLCKLNHVFLGFYGIHPFPLPFPPSVLTFTSTSLTLGWINLIGAEREAGPPGLGRGLTGWAGGWWWRRLSGLPQAQEASRGRWDWRRRVRRAGLFLLQSLTWSQGCDDKWTEMWNWEQKCQKWICLDGMKGQRRDGGTPWGRDSVGPRGTQQPTETSFILPSPSGMHRETNE